MHNYFFTSTDNTLILCQLESILELLPAEEWLSFGKLLDIPPSLLKEIFIEVHDVLVKKQRVLEVYEKKHPQPSWEHVADVLYRHQEGEYHDVLHRLQSVYPTG